MLTDERIITRDGDLSPYFDAKLREEGVSAWDIETDGLDFRSDAIRTCQVYVPGFGVEIVQLKPGIVPPRLSEALHSERVFKVFHHAPFDLRFMRAQWGIRPRNVACTKVMSKIITPEREQHSLKDLVSEYLQVDLDKGERLSDWSSHQLTPQQVAYAAGDVLHLIDLFRLLWKEALNSGVGDLVERSFGYLPTRVETELRGAGDVFSY